jgi:hypothetical protein
MLFGIKSANFNVGKSISDKMDIKSQFVIPISANELVKDVLNATAGIILGTYTKISIILGNFNNYTNLVMYSW